MATQIQIRRDISANWTTTNPILAQGELAQEIDTLFMKIGDGITDWVHLNYLALAGYSGYSGFSGYSGYSGYSTYVNFTTSGNNIALGSMTFTDNVGLINLGFIIGQYVTLTFESSGNLIWCSGFITSYDNTTGVLVVNIDNTNNIGALGYSWTVSLSIPGISGFSGFSGFSGYSGVSFDPTDTNNLHNIMSTGLLSGGLVTINGTDNTKFDVSAGVGYIVDNYTDPLNPTITKVTWSDQIGVTDTYLATDDETYIAINAGGDVEQNIAFTDAQRRDLIILGFTGHLTHTVIQYAISEPAPLIHDVENQMFDFWENFGAFNIDGNVISANGANLNINRSAGDTWSFGDNYKNSNKVPNVVSTPDRTAQSFYYWYTDGSGKWLSTNTNTINPNLRDTLTGTTAVSTDKWTIQTLQYYAPLDEIDIQYGQKEYDNLQDALSDINNLNFVFNPFNNFDTFRGWLVVQEGCTDLSNVNQAQFVNVNKYGMLSGRPASSNTLLENVVGTGVQWGGILSVNTDNTKFDISAGAGWIVNNTTGAVPVATKVTWSAFTAQSDIYLTSYPRTYIYIDNGGNIVQEFSPPASTDLRTKLYIGRTVHTNLSTITSTVAEPAMLIDNSAYLHDFYLAIGALNVTGNTISPNGTNLSFNRSAGTTFRLNANARNSLTDPNIVTDNAATPQSFKYELGHSGYTTWTVGSSVTVIDPTHWDDGSGTLQSVTVGNWTIQRVYLSAQYTGTPNIYVFYGQKQYASLTAAINGTSQDVVIVDPSTSEYTLLGYIIVSQGCTALNDSGNCSIITSGKFGGSAGPQGVVGPQGPTGGFTMLYEFSTSLSTTPASGRIDYDNATPSLVTNIYISETDRNGVSVDAYLDAMQPGDYIRIFSETSNTNYHIYIASGVIDYSHSGHDTIPVTWVAGNGVFSDAVYIGFSTATKGAMGYSGYSGYSGISGASTSGFSGYSGLSGTSGLSGISGFSGYSGLSGISGFSGYSGLSGISGFSGYSGLSGISGFSGYSGLSGISGFSGYSGLSGISGYSG